MKSPRRRYLHAVALVISLACAALSFPATSAAATASWRFEPPSFDFGVRLPAEGPTSASFELKDTGETSLTPGFVSVSGSGFKLTGDECGHTLSPGSSCTIEVTFDPREAGRYDGTLTVESSGQVAPPATVQLTGSGGEPIVVINPPAFTFDTIPIPTNSLPGESTRTLTITNAGSADLSISGLGYEEPGAPFGVRPDFFVNGSSAGPGRCVYATIPPGGSCSLELAFSPESPGTFTAVMKLQDNAAGSPQLIPLYGTAVAQPAATPPPAPKEASYPKFARKPPLSTKARTATFAFSVESSPGGFKCRSDAGKRFRACRSPVHLRRLKPGLHVFSVRGVGADGTPGPVATYYWRVVR